jgi:hypothetical protein
MEHRIKKIISYKGPIKDAPSDYEFWKTQSHEDRIAAIEILRKQFYNEATPRLQRVYRITKRKRS